MRTESNVASTSTVHQVHEIGQSIWYDNISREILANGELARYVSEWGIRGLTSNPTIFCRAIKGSDVYDAQLAELAGGSVTPEDAFEAIAVADIGAAADVLHPIYEESGGNDGFVSIEVSPTLAHDATATVAEAKRLVHSLARPNIMIKVPGTTECLPAIRTLLAEGIHVNVTLLFSLENYLAVANAYIAALEDRLEAGLPIDQVRSVASFFVSRVDGVIDAALAEIASDDSPENAERAQEASTLLGEFGVANSRVAYRRFEELFASERFQKLANDGAAVQRLLWASTGTKNPDDSDVLYVEELAGPNTVNTVPHKTLEAFLDHGKAESRIANAIDDAEACAGRLEALGIDVAGALVELQRKGVDSFVASFEELHEAIAAKL